MSVSGSIALALCNISNLSGTLLLLMKTLKLRIKDQHAKVLQQLASEVNLVWNCVNELGFKYLKRTDKFCLLTILTHIHCGFLSTKWGVLGRQLN